MGSCNESMSYEFEAFFSYKRHTLTNGWHDIVRQKIAFYTGQELELGRDAKIFFDTEDIQSGDVWRNKLSSALQKSKCVVCILTPNYFQSQYCVSELNAFIERSSLTGKSLVVSASGHDGESFPIEFKDAWQYKNFSKYMNTASGFWDSGKAADFDEYLKEFAKDLAQKILSAPDFSDQFPVTLHGIQPQPIPLPRPGDVI